MCGRMRSEKKIVSKLKNVLITFYWRILLGVSLFISSPLLIIQKKITQQLYNGPKKKFTRLNCHFKKYLFVFFFFFRIELFSFLFFVFVGIVTIRIFLFCYSTINGNVICYIVLFQTKWSPERRDILRTTRSKCKHKLFLKSFDEWTTALR